MKKLVLSTVVLLTTSLFSCNNSKKIITNNYNTVNSTEIPDSTKVPGYNPSQRAFALYLRSLPKEQKDKWVNTGSYSEKEMNNLIDTIDYRKGN